MLGFHSVTMAAAMQKVQMLQENLAEGLTIISVLSTTRRMVSLATSEDLLYISFELSDSLIGFGLCFLDYVHEPHLLAFLYIFVVVWRVLLVYWVLQISIIS